MKLTEYQGNKTVSNMASVDIGISDDPTDQLLILNVLSNTLYTDKVTAVWREYGCNAFDANVEAGKGETPIEITLPTKLAPEAKIRDFGYGMTREQVLQVFCKLGRSTKRGSNELIGMLGIGSKAGFAYGDNFTVTCWAKGQKTIYTCFRDQGVPRLSEMFTEASDAPEGVEIKVPVKLTDITDFITKAERVFRFFKVRPIIHGGTITYQVRGNPKFAGTGWRYLGNEQDSHAIMGNIGYTINTASLPTTFGMKRLALLKLGVELDFEIGELEIAANREGLQFKDQTVKAIGAKLDIMIKEIAKTFTDAIAKATCLWEAKKLFRELFEGSEARIYRSRSLRDVVDTSITWNKKPITTGRISVANKESDPAVAVVGYTRRGWGRRKMVREDHPDEVWCQDSTNLVINDLPSKKISPSRLVHWFDQNQTTDVIIIFTFFTQAAQARFFGKRELTGAPTINMSSMPKPPPKVGAVTGGSTSIHRSKHSTAAFRLRAGQPSSGSAQSYYTADSQYWDIEDVDLKKDSGVYVKIDRFIATATNGAGVSPARLQTQIAAFKKAGLFTGHLYGFKERKWDKVAASGNWTECSAHIKAGMDKLLADTAVQQELADYLHAASHQSIVDVKFVKNFPSGSLIRDYLDEVIRMRNPAKNKEVWALLHGNEVRQWFTTPGKLPKPTTDLAAFVRKLYARYGMLEDWDEYKLRGSSQKDLQPAIDYVTLVEDNI